MGTRTRRLGCAAAIALSALVPAGNASARPQIVDLGTLGGDSSVAYDINDAGRIVGMSTTATGEVHAVLWEDGEIIDLGAAMGPYSKAHAINDAGVIVGTVSYGYDSWSVVWAADGTVQQLPTFGGFMSEAWDVNNGGEVAGWSWIPTAATHAFVWDAGSMSDIGGNDPWWTNAWAINDRGAVVGSSSSGAFLWDGTLQVLNTPAAQLGVAADINNRGQVVGTGQAVAGRSQAFVWQDGVTTFLPTLGGWLNEAQAINDRGQIVGHSNVAGWDIPFHAALWYRGSVTDLGMLPGAPQDWGIGSTAMGINNRGDAVGFSITPTGETHAVLWPAH